MKKIVFLIMCLFLIGMTESHVMAKCIPPTFITEETIQGMKVATGGVGLEERACMIGLSKHYDLKLVFAETSGAYLSNIPVIIENAEGKEVIRTESTGPWFLVELPEGSYKVKAEYKDQTQVKDVAVAQGLQSVMFHWE